MEDKIGRAQFFQESLLLATTSMKIVLRMAFLTFSNANIYFAEKDLTRRSYTTAKTLLTTKQVKVIDKNEFAKPALDEKSKTFVVHKAALEPLLVGMIIHLLQKVQISALI